ncbi:MAG: hypothetical protein EBY17_00490 [Acidobacteriia bacterium]|nr:hypothetical protein [Terriglobia bacterium]
MKVDLLKMAIDTNDFGGVRELMSSDPALHAAPLGYNKNGPLTWVAECRVPWGPPSAERLTMAAWMLENGSDVHQGGDGPLIRTALNRMRSLQAVTDTAVVTKLVKCEAGANSMDSSACGRPLKSAAVFRFKDPDGNTLSISEHPEYPSS